MSDETKGKIVAEMEARFGSKVTLQNFTSVSASVGGEVTRAASIAILFAAAAILLYIWWAFRNVEHAYRYGTAAIIAMLHDVLVVLGVEAMFGYFLGWEADALNKILGGNLIVFFSFVPVDLVAIGRAR